MTRYVVVRRVDTDEVVHRVTVSGSERKAAKVQRGMEINMDLERFYTEVQEA